MRFSKFIVNAYNFFHGMLKKTLYLALLFALALASGQTTVFHFMNLDPSGRGGAMGGAFVSMMNHPNLIFYNPAGLATVTDPQFSMSYMKHILDINSGFASFAETIPNFGSVGAGVQYMNYGWFDLTDQNAKCSARSAPATSP